MNSDSEAAGTTAPLFEWLKILHVWEPAWCWAAAEREYLLCQGRAECRQQLGSGQDGFQLSAPSPSRPGCCNNVDVTLAAKEEASKVRCLNIDKCSKYNSMRVFNSTVSPAGSLTPVWIFFGSTHYHNVSESKVRLRTPWWHINICLEDMGIPAGDCRDFNSGALRGWIRGHVFFYRTAFGLYFLTVIAGITAHVSVETAINYDIIMIPWVFKPSWWEKNKNKKKLKKQPSSVDGLHLSGR